MFADTHCHLDFESFDGRIESIKLKMDQSSLEMIVVPSVSVSNWDKVISLSGRDKRFMYALGLHPYFIQEHQLSDVSLLDEKLSGLLFEGDSRLVALGEIGLDATRPDIKKQLELLEMQLSLAEKHKLPVILHIRKLHSQLIDILKKYTLVGGVVHAFSGSFELMMRYVDLGFMIGVGPVITWETATKTRSAVAKAPLSSLLLETDSPDMYVGGKDKSKACPLDVIEVFHTLSAIRVESKAELMDEIWSNSMRFFSK